VATVADARRAPTLLPLVIANSVPIIGVLVLGWDLRSIMFVYWLETAVVVFYSELKIVIVGGPFTLVWLPVHLAMFGAFMSVHLTMILPLGPTPHGGGMFPPAVIGDLLKRTWGAGVSLFVSHGISFVVDFLGNGEYKRTTVNAEVAAPWKRIFIMHVTTIVGAWSVMLFAAPVGAIVALSLLKIAVDAHGHVGERAAPADTRPARVDVQPATKIDGVLRLFGGFLIFCGVLLSAGVGGEVYRAARVRSQWPMVDAQVLDCRVRERAASRSRDTSHTVQCRFRYDAAGAEHVSTLSTHSTWNPATVAAMRRWVSRHRPGSIQRIHYDPSTPDTISLGEFGEAIDPVLVGETLTAAGGFAGAGALLLVLALWRARLAARLQPAS
jgi:hypothetical protein